MPKNKHLGNAPNHVSGTTNSIKIKQKRCQISVRPEALQCAFSGKDPHIIIQSWTRTQATHRPRGKRVNFATYAHGPDPNPDLHPARPKRRTGLGKGLGPQTFTETNYMQPPQHWLLGGFWNARMETLPASTMILHPCHQPADQHEPHAGGGRYNHQCTMNAMQVQCSCYNAMPMQFGIQHTS